VDANPAACSFYGYDQATLTAMRLSQIDTLSEADSLAQLARAEMGQGDRFLFGHRLASGEVRNVEVFSGPIRLDGKALIYAIVHDVTIRAQREREMEAIVTVATALRNTQTRPEMYAIILNQVQELLGCDRAALCLRDPLTGETVFEETIGKIAYPIGTRTPGTGIAGIAIQTGQPSLANDARHDARLALNDPTRLPHALAAVPMVARTRRSDRWSSAGKARSATRKCAC
jgi:PAS domain S-box-containing protein